MFFHILCLKIAIKTCKPLLQIGLKMLLKGRKPYFNTKGKRICPSWLKKYKNCAKSAAVFCSWPSFFILLIEKGEFFTASACII